MNTRTKWLLSLVILSFMLLGIQTVSGKIDTPLWMRQSATPVPCIISTTQSKTISVRVGPGENRTPVAFLPTNVEFTVLGRYVADDESVWYQIDPKQAAPKKSINEAWVAADGLDEEGDCEAIADADAPPIIPIMVRPTAAPAGSEQPAEEQPSDSAPAGSIQLQSGNYTIGWAPVLNVSCEGYSNIAVNATEQGFTSGIISVYVRGNTIIVGGYTTTLQSNGSYVGQVEIEGMYGTFVIWPASATVFGGDLIASYTIQGHNCSGSISYTASKS